MRKIISLFLFIVILVFFTYQEANAITISASPQKPEFGPNDWIKINLKIDGYNGGPISWIAHRPDNSVTSGIINQISKENVVHQIIRDASDNQFGIWTIDYLYENINQTVQFKVNSLNLLVNIDKEIYYEPEIMKINITSDYYNLNARLTPPYYLNFYDVDGNLVNGIDTIEIKALQSSIVYSFPLLQFAKYNSPGDYKLRIQYFNSFAEVPFSLGDINKLMEITVRPNLDTYHIGDKVILDMIFTKVRESTGILKITTPSGNMSNQQFHVDSVHTSLALDNITEELGTYKFEIQYAGVTNSGSFNVITGSTELPKIEFDVSLNKLNYRPGETIYAKVFTSDFISDSMSIWAVNPDGIETRMITLPIITNNSIIPYKIPETFIPGLWKLYFNYSGIIMSSNFYINDSPVQDLELHNPVQFLIPTFISEINSTTFKSPTGIAVDSENNVYIVDSGNFKVEKFDSNGKLIFSWGNPESLKGQFSHPSGIYVNKKFVYVTDIGNAKIDMFSTNGSFVYSWGTYGENPGMFHIPVSISSDRNDSLYVADSGRNVIQIFDIRGNYKDEIHPMFTKGGGFLGINSLVFDSKNNFYAISTDNKILKYSTIGNFLNFYGSSGSENGRFDNPLAIAMDSKNNFYVADTHNHRIQKFDSDGNFLLSWRMEGSEAGNFEEPVALAIDSSDNMYVVDKKKNTIQKFELYNGSSSMAIPNWIKDTALWWSEGVTDRKDFAQSIRSLISQDLIKPSPPTMQINDIVIPHWVHTSAKLWYFGQIDDNTFLRSVQYLISEGIMKV